MTRSYVHKIAPSWGLIVKVRTETYPPGYLKRLGKATKKVKP